MLPVAENIHAMSASNRRHLSASGRRQFARCLFLNLNFLGTDCRRIKSLFAELFLHRVEVKVAEFDFDAEHLSQM